MKKLTYTLEIQSPVVMSDTTGGQNHIKSLNYIPGSTMLGVFAGKYIANNNSGKNAHKNAEFQRLFLSDAVRFLNANIEGDGKRTIKIPLYFEQLKQENGEVFNNYESPQPKGIDRKSAKAVSGFSDGKQKLSVKKEVAFHTSRFNNRTTGKSEDGKVFTYEGIARGQTMQGNIVGNESDLNSLKSLFSDDDIVHLGRSKTAQYGEAKLKFGEIKTIEEKLKGENITLQFRSPVLLTNKFGFPTTEWEYLKQDLEILGLSNIDLKENTNGWTTASAKSISVENYNRKWGAKKPSHQAFSAGSTFKFSANGDIAGFVKSITENGLGLRTNEGFGEVSVETLTTNSFGKYNMLKRGKPTSKMPVKLFKAIIENEILKLAEMEGTKIGFNKKLPNSVTGQLLDVLRNADNDEKIKTEMQRHVTTRETWNKPEVGDKKSELKQDILKKFAQNMKEVKVNGKSLWNEFSNAKSDDFCHTISSKSDFLKSFLIETNISLTDFDFKAYQTFWIIALTKMMKGVK